MADHDHQVPAGWYPDPLGLPQLRWWDNHAWTEHTSDARQPMVAQETVTSRLAYADEEAGPSREPLHPDADGTRPGGEPGLATADPVLSLEAAPQTGPLTGLRTGPQLIPAAPQPASSYDELLGVPLEAQPVEEASPQPSSEHLGAFSFHADEAFGPFRASSFSPASFAGHVAAPVAAPAFARGRAVAEGEAGVSTGPVWIIALMPLVMLLLALLFLLAGDAGRDSGLFAGVILGGSYLATVILAIIDRAMLARLGHARTANWDWALLGAPIYLVARMANLVRDTGRGLRPFLTWTALSALLVGAAIAVPGIVIALVPGAFSDEAEASIAEDARILGLSLTASCPEVPPLLIGGTMECLATANGESAELAVSLVRQNGWIDWRVEDWGPFAR